MGTLKELIAKARAGDADAFTALVRNYQAMVFGCAVAALGDPHLAEDAAQQAFLTAYRRLAHLQDPDRFGAWLRGIVRFECAHLRRGRRVAQVPIELAAEISAPTPGPAQQAEAREMRSAVLAAVDALPEREREATILFYLQEYSQPEIAAFLNLPVSTVNNRLRAARNRLKQGGLLAMTQDAIARHTLPADFAERIGQIVRAERGFIDARFAANERPPVLNALTITDDATNVVLTAEVAQHLGDDLVRCIPVTNPDHPMPRFRPGTRIVDTAALIQAPLDTPSVVRAITALRDTPSATAIQETGIKVIDLLCPIPAGGTIGIVGDMQTGKMVIVEELIHRLANATNRLTILVFVEVATEAAEIPRLDYRTSATVEAVYLPVADADPDALRDATAQLDATITLTRALGRQGLYPAIDPLRSRSRLLTRTLIGADQIALVNEARTLLAGDADNTAPDCARRAVLLRHYFSQPFFVAEAFTNRPGQFVARDAAVADCRQILSGAHDDLAPDSLFMTGAIKSATPTT